MCVFSEKLCLPPHAGFVLLPPTSCWLDWGCDCDSLGSVLYWEWWNHKIEGVTSLPCQPWAPCPWTPFTTKEKYTSVLFPSLLFWVSFLANRLSANAYNSDSIYVKNSKQTYICRLNGWFWLGYRNPRDDLPLHWRHITLHNNKSRGGPAEFRVTWLHHQGLGYFPSF